MTTEIVKAGGALAIRPDQTEWTPEQAAVLKQSGISNDVTSAELSGFLHLCQRTQLDPFSRQIYLIGRFDNREKRKVFTPQTGIDGYRVVAHRVVGASGEGFGYEETQWCDASGRWRDVWLSDSPPAAAKVVVVRRGQRFPAVARFSEYAQTTKDGGLTSMWRRMPATMVAKCAEALALRMAFPHDLAGVYTAEEMAQADNPAPVAEQQPGTVRQLRRVQPGEADPWQTPAPTAAPAAAAPQREYLQEALDAPDAATIRQIWLDARADGAVPEYLEQIAQVGREKTAQPAPAPAPAPAADDVIDGEIVEEDEHTKAIRQLHKTATDKGLAEKDLEEAFYQVYGLAMKDAATESVNAMRGQLMGGAA